MRKVTFLLSLAFLGGFLNTAYSQTDVWANMAQRREMQKIIDRGVVNQIMIIEATKALKGQGRQKSTTAKTETALKPVFATGITSFEFNDQYLLPDALAKDFQGNAEEKAELRKTVAGLLDHYKSVALKDGFPANDLAYGFNYFIFHNFYIYSNIRCINDANIGTTCLKVVEFSPDLSPEVGIYNQFRTKLAADKDVAKMTDSEKQLLVESMAVKVMMLWERWEKAQNSSNFYDIKMESKQNLEELFKTDVENISLSEEGIKLSN